ncbi:hypothetical protein RFI_00730 [Reticulomyxa filosa]|uniref:non-specific serine/threonine protein kinase n=1 Tax=Reticulomyxa filosa TaxID=46433 RepID=X6PDZ7_RETFI|nr:hypothetical protein RFI_00730 [Reticulomyxa filosa]|eukprot:ETO36333.1 hypothetical protein RFI_00730 [Reticulomyxa filosa]
MIFYFCINTKIYLEARNILRFRYSQQVTKAPVGYKKNLRNILKIIILSLMTESASDFKIEGELIQQGAEARIYKSGKSGKEVILKYRFPKTYRHPSLDERLRKARTKAVLLLLDVGIVYRTFCWKKMKKFLEVKLIKKAEAAKIRVPKVLREDRNNCLIVMEYITLPSVRQILKQYYDPENHEYLQKEGLVLPLLRELGTCIAKLHESTIIHGDLTTSNMFYDIEKRELILIDFGLSNVSMRAEDMAVDLYVLERALISTHNNSEFMIEIIYQSYIGHFSEKNNRGKEVLKRLEVVKQRGRKRSMVG